MSSCGFLLLSAVFSTTGRAFSSPWLITASLFIAGSQGTSLECDIRPVRNVILLGHLAVFECEATGGVTDWIINGTNYNNNAPEVREDMIKDENSMPKTLTISNTFKYNNTQVQCKTYESIEEIYPYEGSEIATLLIQGVLSAVGELILNSNATSITISWTAPWSLDHDIWYSVLIKNMTDENNPMIVNCTNITETFYTFTPHHLSATHKYNITVTPFNGAGQGESRSNITSSIDRVGQISSQTKGVLTTVIDLADTTTPTATPPHGNGTQSDGNDHKKFYAFCILLLSLVIIPFGILLIKCCRRKDQTETTPEQPQGVQVGELIPASKYGMDETYRDLGTTSEKILLAKSGKDETSVRKRQHKTTMDN